MVCSAEKLCPGQMRTRLPCLHRPREAKPTSRTRSIFPTATLREAEEYESGTRYSQFRCHRRPSARHCALLGACLTWAIAPQITNSIIVTFFIRPPTQFHPVSSFRVRRVRHQIEHLRQIWLSKARG